MKKSDVICHWLCQCWILAFTKIDLYDDLSWKWFLKFSHGAAIASIIKGIYLASSCHLFSFFLIFLNIIHFPRDLDCTYVQNMIIWAWSLVSWLKTFNWFVLWFISLFSWLSKIFSRVFSNINVEKHHILSILCLPKSNFQFHELSLRRSFPAWFYLYNYRDIIVSAWLSG